MMARVATCVAVIALVVVIACGGNKQDEPGTTVKAQDLAKRPGDGPPERAAITPRSLSPVLIHELGAEDVVPTAIVIELASPIIDRDAVGSPSHGASLKLSPALDGSLIHTGISELTFTPSRPFDFDTTYQVELTGVDTLDGVVAPAAGETWSYAFKTPAFKFLGWAPSGIDLDHHKIAMDIAFSGAVLPNLARAAMSFAIDGKPAAGVALQPSGNPSHVAVVLGDPRIALGSKLSLAIKGLTSLTSARAAAASADYVVSGDQAISIKTATIVEGANGFYLEVICDDSAAPDGHRAYYEGQGYYNLSQRCQLTDDAIKHVHFAPR